MKLTTKMVYGQTAPYSITLLIMKRADIDTTMGLNLKKIRTRNNLTQEALAALINVSQGLIPRWESGGKGIGKDVLIKLCNALNVQPWEFHINNTTPLPATELECKALYMARDAENAHLNYIAEEIIGYGTQRIQTVKKGGDKSRQSIALQTEKKKAPAKRRTA